jgi:DNA-binding PucR family transcriptional regulator
MLLELYESDLEKNTNNLEVLYTFLMNERRATETAAYLHMHRNNVVYRISRIEEMLNVNLNDILTRFNLVMSFMMLKSSGVSFENAG